MTSGERSWIGMFVAMMLLAALATAALTFVTSKGIERVTRLERLDRARP
jgi:archaellum component FlaG (FlaF/FlaG flagellin family)